MVAHIVQMLRSGNLVRIGLAAITAGKFAVCSSREAPHSAPDFACSINGLHSPPVLGVGFQCCAQSVGGASYQGSFSDQAGEFCTAV